MRIAFIGQKGIPVSQGGVERHVEELAKRLVLRGHEVLVYNRSTYKTGDSILPSGIKIVRIPSLAIKGWDTIIASFLSSLDVLFRKVDVVHYHSIGPALFSFLVKLFKPSAKLVFTHHTFEAQRPQWGLIARLAMHLGERFGLWLADEVIAISPAMAVTLEAKHKRIVSTVPNGVSKFDESEQTSFALPQNYILAVSRLIRSKRLDHLINAFNLISPDHPDYHLLIVGAPVESDNDEPRLRALAAGNDNIKFLGQQSSSVLGKIYKNATVFVQPSDLEGLPITLLEAASLGVPIVASDIPEHTVILRSEAVLFKSGSHIDLAAKLRFILDEPEKHRQAAAKLAARINKDFNWDEITANVAKIYARPVADSKILVIKQA